MQPALRITGVILVAASALTSLGAAQTRARVTTDENFRLAPRADASILARITAGTEVGLVRTDGDWREITVEGWIWGRSVRASSGEFDLAVSAGGENLRIEPNGTVIARVESGTLLDEVSRRDGWVRVRRTAWMWGRSLSPIRPAASATARPPAAAATPAQPPPAPVDPLASLDRRTLLPGSALVTRPGGDTVASLTGRTGARVVTSADGWARVLVEAWVREADLSAPDDSALTGVTAAEVRGSGAAYEGRTLRWTVQFIAVQAADELRRDIPAGQSYMLARGPLPETGFVYVVLGPEQVRAVTNLEPLARITLLGRVRRARSQYLGNPVLDLIEFTVEGRR